MSCSRRSTAGRTAGAACPPRSALTGGGWSVSKPRLVSPMPCLTGFVVPVQRNRTGGTGGGARHRRFVQLIDPGRARKPNRSRNSVQSSGWGPGRRCSSSCPGRRQRGTDHHRAPRFGTGEPASRGCAGWFGCSPAAGKTGLSSARQLWPTWPNVAGRRHLMRSAHRTYAGGWPESRGYRQVRPTPKSGCVEARCSGSLSVYHGSPSSITASRPHAECNTTDRANNSYAADAHSRFELPPNSLMIVIYGKRELAVAATLGVE